MRPRRFFVFIEGGDGFWLAAEDAEKIRKYLNRRWGLDLKAQALAGGVRLLGRGLRRVGLVLYALGSFLLAVALLSFLRLFSDTYYYRFRFFGKNVTLHPSRECRGEAAGSGIPRAQA